MASLNLSLNFLNLCIEDNFLVHLFTPWASSLPTSSLSQSFTSILNITPTCSSFSFSFEPLSFNNSLFSSIQQLFVPFSPQISNFSIPLFCPFYPRRYDSASFISLHVSTCQLLSSLDFNIADAILFRSGSNLDQAIASRLTSNGGGDPLVAKDTCLVMNDARFTSHWGAA